MVDDKNKKCVEEVCKKQPTFNFPGEQNPKFCSNHKKADMVNVVSKKCIEEGCNKIPAFNFPGQKKWPQ